MYNWQLIHTHTLAELLDSQLTEAQAGEKKVTLLKKSGAIYAFAATCPHAGARLCDGWLDAQGRVVCALHKYRFDPANGRNTSGEGYKLMTYPTMVKDGKIYIGLLAS